MADDDGVTAAEYDIDEEQLYSPEDLWPPKLWQLSVVFPTYRGKSQREHFGSLGVGVVLFAVLYVVMPFPGKEGLLDLPPNSTSVQYLVSLKAGAPVSFYYALITMRARGHLWTKGCSSDF